MAKRMITLDGTTLEGGGQLLRIASGLSALTGTPIRIDNIRGKRGGGGGLKLQHLKAVNWLASASAAVTVGAEKGSKTLEFSPQDLVPSSNSSPPSAKIPTKIDIGSPGSVGLVFQAILPFLIFAGSAHDSNSKPKEINVTIKGGTNVSKSPSADYLDQVLLPTLAKIGLPPINLRLEKRGWSTGQMEMGSISFGVTPIPRGHAFQPFSLEGRGDILSITATILGPRACKKESRRQVEAKVSKEFPGAMLDIIFEDSYDTKRLYLLLVATSSNGHKLGRDWLFDEKIRDLSKAVAKIVERVLGELVNEAQHGGCVDEYMRDQLVIFQALAEGRSKIEMGNDEEGKARAPSLHTSTAYWVAKELLGVQFDQQGLCNGIGFAIGKD